jgi:hypothetical protein
VSAWLCSRAHIAAIVEGYREHCKPDATTQELSEIGADLWQENWDSVVYRYAHRDGNGPQPVYCTHQKPKRHYSPAEVGKALRCFEYQSCEHPAWEKSEARRLLREIAWSLLSELPGYADAPWGIDDELGRG